MRVRNLAALVILSILAASTVTAGAAADRTETFYSVSAHPDDELAGWALIQDRPSTYTVFVIMTKGEFTTSCMTPEESTAPQGPEVGDLMLVEGFTGPDPLNLQEEEYPGGDKYHGPYKYQGPASLVGQPDRGERHPLGFPWTGRGSQACKDARVASWHWFLDGMAEMDPTLAHMNVVDDPRDDDDYRGEFCTPGVACAEVWANEDGARVAFDNGDGKLTVDNVAASLQALRANRAAWGIRVLPEAGVLANAYYADESSPACLLYAHPDHRAVRDAIYTVDFGAGPQFGGMCADRFFLESPGPVLVTDPATLVFTNYVDPLTEHRIGPYNVNYGWLFPTYQFTGSLDPTFWRRFG